jgi:hypothetical protein
MEQGIQIDCNVHGEQWAIDTAQRPPTALPRTLCILCVFDIIAVYVLLLYMPTYTPTIHSLTHSRTYSPLTLAFILVLPIRYFNITFNNIFNPNINSAI